MFSSSLGERPALAEARYMSDNESTPTLRIRGPVDLLQGVPYLLGFHPAQSLVLIGLNGGRLVVTVRLDLADLESPDVLPDALDAMECGGTGEVVAVVYDNGETNHGSPAYAPWIEPAELVGQACDDADLVLVDVLGVDNGRWWSALCPSPQCCPPEGTPLPQSPSAFVAEATYAGLVALPDRESLARRLEPLPESERSKLEPLISACETEAVKAVLDGSGEEWDRALEKDLFLLARGARDAAAAAELTDEQVARFAVALSSTGQRDSIWTAVDAGGVDGRALWRELARRAPSPYDAAPLFLYGWASWRAGNGALAGIAAQRTVDSDPTYSAADLLMAVLAHGVDPRQLPRFGLKRSA